MNNDTPIKISRGISSKLPQSIQDGNIYFCTDIGNIKIDAENSRFTLLSSDNTKTQSIEGKLNIKSSLLIGKNLQSFGDNSYVQGDQIVAYGNNSHAEGAASENAIILTLTGNGNSVIYYYTGSNFEPKVGNIIKYNNVLAQITDIDQNEITLDQTLSSNSLDGTAVEIIQYGALKNNAHSEGFSTIALGVGSHVEGQGTIATADYSHVEGTYNIEDTEKKYIHIVGNGTSADRSNAYTLDKSGNAWFAGTITLGVEKVATQPYVDNKVETYVNNQIGAFLNGSS